MNDIQQERLARGQLPEKVLEFLTEKGPMTLTQLAHVSGREGSNLVGALRHLQEEGRVVKNLDTKVWSIKEKGDSWANGEAEVDQPENPVIPPPTEIDPIEAAIRVLKDTGKQTKKLARIKEALLRVIAIIDTE